MATIVEDFESATPVVPRTGNWSRNSQQAFSGSWSLRSATISDGTTDCDMTVPAGATSVTFRCRVSTEEDWHWFRFFVNGVKRYEASGVINQWVQPGTYAVTPGQTIRFRYERDDEGGGGSNAVWIDDVTFTIPDTEPPGTPPNLRITDQGVDSVSVAWDAATDNFGVTGYGVYLDGVKQGDDQPGLSYDFDGLAPASYLIEVDAVDGDGNRSAKASLVVQFDSEPPSTPPNLRVTAVSPDSVSVAWDASTDNIGVAGYGVYLDGIKQDDDQPGLSYDFTDLATGVDYLVEVDAADAAGNRSAKASLVVAPEADETSPSAPSNLAVTGGGPYSVSVAWDAATDNIGVTGYGVYLDGVKQGPDVPGLSYVFEGLAAETSYLIEVDAVDPSDNRSARVQLEHTTPADLPPGTPPGLAVVAVSYTSWSVAWEPAADDVAVVGYDVAVDGVLVAENADVLMLAREGLPDDTDYLVQVWAVDQLGQRSPTPAELVVRTLNDEDPTAPEFEATAGEDTITVAWGEASDDFGVVGYEVVVGGQVVHATPGLDYTVDGPVVRRFTVDGLIPGQSYPVRVAAVDTIGQRSPDNTQIVTTTAVPWTPIATPVYRLGSWAGNVRDEFGVDWIVEEVEGWSGSAPVSPTSAVRGGMDGDWDGAGRFGPRRVVLSGVAVAPTHQAMLAASQRMARVMFPEERVLLRVTDAVMTRQAWVRLDEDPIDIRVQTRQVFWWRVAVVAKDPRRYAPTPVRAEAVIGELPGEAAMTVVFEGTYRKIPARLRLYGPIQDWTITHRESGAVMRAKPGVPVPADPNYSYTIDLRTRQVWGHVPAEVWPVPRPGRSALAHLPAWWTCIPGPNTIVLAGDPVPGQEGTPRLVLEAYDAWG